MTQLHRSERLRLATDDGELLMPLVGLLKHIYVCPDCGAVKDQHDPDRYQNGEQRTGKARQRWCHNYAAHGRHGGGAMTQRKMTLVTVRVERIGQ